MENAVGQRPRLTLLERPTPRPPTPPPSPCPPPATQPRPKDPATRKSWCRPADHPCPHRAVTDPRPAQPADGNTKSPIHGFRLRLTARRYGVVALSRAITPFHSAAVS